MMLTIDTKITIDAPCHIIWHHLTDFSKYKEWNTFITSINGDMKTGGKLDVLIHPPGGKPMRFKPIITKYEAGRSFRWLGSIGFKGMFDGEHVFTCEAQDESKSIFIQQESFSGFLVPLFWNTMHAKTKLGFEQMNQQLKERSEKDVWGK